MAELNLDSPEAKGLAIELAKYGNRPAPTPEYTTLKDKYNQITGYNDIMKKAALANNIETGLAHLNALPLIGNVAKIPGTTERVLAQSVKPGTLDVSTNTIQDVMAPKAVVPKVVAGEQQVLAKMPETKYPTALHKYHESQAKALGYKDVDAMYDDFYKNYDVMDTYTDRAFTNLKDAGKVQKMVDAGLPEKYHIQAEAMNGVLKDLRKGKTKANGYQMDREIQSGMHDDPETYILSGKAGKDAYTQYRLQEEYAPWELDEMSPKHISSITDKFGAEFDRIPVVKNGQQAAKPSLFKQAEDNGITLGELLQQQMK